VSKSVISVDRVTKRFSGHTAVKQFSLEVPQGAVFGLLGPNGAGKTTTIRMIMDIIRPDEGRVTLFGGAGTGRDLSARIGFLPEERGLYPKMQVLAQLAFLAEIKGLSRKDALRRGAEWLNRLGLGEWADKKIEDLSKGMQQKVQFIGTLMHDPDLVILDEPFSGLDPVNTDVLRQEVLELRRQGATVIFSTHDMSVAEKLCDFIFMIYKGDKVLDGTLSDIQGSYGQDIVRVSVEGNGFDAHAIDGVERVTDFGALQELRMAEGTDTQSILRSLMAAGRVTRFELAKPSLHDIFVRIAGPEAMEASDTSQRNEVADA